MPAEQQRITAFENQTFPQERDTTVTQVRQRFETGLGIRVCNLAPGKIVDGNVMRNYTDGVVLRRESQSQIGGARFISYALLKDSDPIYVEVDFGDANLDLSPRGK